MDLIQKRRESELEERECKGGAKERWRTEREWAEEEKGGGEGGLRESVEGNAGLE